MSEFDYVKKKREEVDVIPANIVPFVRKVMKLYTRLNVWVFKKSNGKWMTKFPGGYPICMVGMTGRKSGQRREVALIHLPHGDNKLLVARKAGWILIRCGTKILWPIRKSILWWAVSQKIMRCVKPVLMKNVHCGRIYCRCIPVLMNIRHARIATFLCLSVNLLVVNWF